jgi:hypothetical protein
MRNILHRGFAAARSRAGRRALRLFACACCRTAWDQLAKPTGQEAVLVIERYADGLESRQALDSARAAVWALPVARDPRAYVTAHGPCQAHWGAITPAHAALPHAYDAAQNAARYAQRAVGFADGAAFAGLLRDIFGNPFRPAPALEPAWLAWNDGTVAKMAAAIYDGRRFADLPLLADALEDAGCADPAILAHCRGGGEHVRGCWVVDLLTGRE